MKIRERVEYATKPEPLVCGPDEPVLSAVQMMSERNYGAIVVTDSQRSVLGLVTERDVLRKLVAGEKNPSQTKVSDIMTKDVRVAKEDDNLIDWLRIMSNERFRRLPIVDENGKLTAIMTQGDFVSYTWPDLMNQAVTLTKSTVGGAYQIFLILGAVLLYTIVVAGLFSAVL